MAVKLEERGRGKFKPAPDYDIKDVQNILFEKIAEEMELIIDQPDTYQFEELHYKEDKANITSLFCGAGGLDLGVELAGLDCVIGEEQTNRSLKDKKDFDSIREEGVFQQ